MSSASSGGGSVAEVRFPGGRHKGCHLAQGKPSDRGDGPAKAGFLLSSRNLSSHTTRSPQLGSMGFHGWTVPTKTPPVRVPGWIFQPKSLRRNPLRVCVCLTRTFSHRSLILKSQQNVIELVTKPAIGQDNGLNRRHAELVIRELAKFHAISYCMKADDNQSVLNKYAYLQV